MVFSYLTNLLCERLKKLATDSHPRGLKINIFEVDMVICTVTALPYRKCEYIKGLTRSRAHFRLTKGANMRVGQRFSTYLTDDQFGGSSGVIRTQYIEQFTA